MDWHVLLAVGAGAIQFLSIVPYVRDMLWGKTRPNIVSWTLWTILQLIAVLAQLSSGFSWSMLLLVAMTINTAFVVALAAMGYGYRHYGALDWTCGGVGVAAIALWLYTGEPLIALVLSVFADFIVAVPTIAKVIREPHSENVPAWFLVAVASLATLGSITDVTVSNLLYPTYLLLVSGLVTALAFFGRRPGRADGAL
jgi:hypothetical protein